MKIEDALKNIDTVVANTRMTRQEHWQLQQDLMLVTSRCQRADELEKKDEDTVPASGD